MSDDEPLEAFLASSSELVLLGELELLSCLFKLVIC